MNNLPDGTPGVDHPALSRDYTRHLIIVSPDEFDSEHLRRPLERFGPNQLHSFKLGRSHVCAIHLANREHTVAHAVAAMHRHLPERHPYELGRNARLRMLGRVIDDPLFSQQWAWRNIRAEAAWKLVDEQLGIQNLPLTTVAIVDWGIQREHQDLDQCNISGKRVIPPDDDNFGDDDGHGTMLAGTIAARRGNHLGGVGTAPRAKLMAIKFIDGRMPPTALYAAMAITYAVDNGARIINASWDVGIDAPVLRKALEHADNENVLVVTAAGNDGSNNAKYATYPADYRYKNVMSVMATDRQDDKPSFSNYGETVDLGAPGVSIYSTSPYLADPQNRLSRLYTPAYRVYSGTSPAAAHVSGAAALLLSINPDWTPHDVRRCLVESADQISGLEQFCPGGRRLNLFRAVKLALSARTGAGRIH
jgi:thermitase